MTTWFRLSMLPCRSVFCVCVLVFLFPGDFSSWSRATDEVGQINFFCILVHARHTINAFANARVSNRHLLLVGRRSVAYWRRDVFQAVTKEPVFIHWSGRYLTRSRSTRSASANTRRIRHSVTARTTVCRRKSNKDNWTANEAAVMVTLPTASCARLAAGNPTSSPAELPLWNVQTNAAQKCAISVLIT